MLIKKVYLSSNATADAAFCSTYAAFLLANEDMFINQGVFVKHYAPGGNKVQKAISSFKVKVKVIDHGVIWKGVSSGVCIPNLKSLSLKVQKL